MPLTAPGALQDLGAFVLGDHALHLQQQIVLRGMPQLAVQEDDIDAYALQLVYEQHLVGVLARQPIRRVHVEAIHPSRCRHIAQLLEGRAHEGRPAVALINERKLVGELGPIGGDALAQGGELTGDRAGAHLVFARHPGVGGCLYFAHRYALSG